jgi:glycosyltransferase involved in cell wall biosynthesis
MSGGSRIIAGHAKRLVAKGHQVTIVAPTPSRPGLRERGRNLFRRARFVNRPSSTHFEQLQLPVLYTGHEGPVLSEDVPDADVIVATWWETAEWVWTFPSEKGAKVHFIQGYEAFPNVPADRVDAVWRLPLFKIAVAQWLVDFGRQRFGIESTTLVPNSIDHKFFKPAPRSEVERPTVGFTFHEAESKDMPTTFRAIELLRARNPEMRLLSFGAQLPDRRALPTDTEFHYLPSQEGIAAIYSRCDAWLSASRSEGFNLPAIEAMACGCPAVCARTGRPQEVIEDGVNGYLVDQGDAAGFAAALATIISLPVAEWTRMSQAAIRTAAHPTWEESNDRFEAALRRTCEASPAAPLEHRSAPTSRADR